jgi:23S rRNA (uracil1939-C5)-methyltransferase
MKLRIEKAIYGGAGLARIGEGELAGKAAFVPLALPGELVEARIVEDKRSFVNAEAESILEASPRRTVPGCPYFGACGGCSYQHAEYAHQLELKTAILREALERARLPHLPPVTAISGQPWSYRNRIRLHTRADPFALCYRERRSNQLLAVATCPIAAKLLQRAIAAITANGASLRLAELCDEMEIFSADENSLLLSCFAGASHRSSKAKLSEICLALRQSLPELRGAALIAAPDRARDKRPARPDQALLQRWGEESLVYQAAGFGYRVSRGSFFQVNRFLVDALVEMVVAERRGRLAWDLYAGVGLFARALAARFERVVAVESSPASSADLRHNLQGTSHRVVQAATADFLRKQKPSATPPDLVVVDPPRAGLGPAIAAALSQIGPAEIVYVSCDPATLSRDLASLVNSGYDLLTITMVDMFPQTFHLESVAVLARK